MNKVWPFEYFQVHVAICKRQSDLFQRFNLDVIEVVNLQQRSTLCINLHIGKYVAR